MIKTQLIPPSEFRIWHFLIGHCKLRRRHTATINRHLMAWLILAAIGLAYPGRAESKDGKGAVDRSPADLAISADGGWIMTANQTSDSVSLIRVSDQAVVDEKPCGQHPACVSFVGNDTVLVTCMWSGELVVFKIVGEQLQQISSIPLGFHPCDIAVSEKGDRAFVGLIATGQVAEVDLIAESVVRRMDVGTWPRYLTLSKDGKRLAVGCSGDSNVTVVDTQSGKMLYDAELANGINLGHMATSPDGQHAYFTWMVYRTNPISVRNIQRGWILASRIGRVRLDGPAYREAISLDVPGKAIGDPHGIAISNDAQHLIASASGTHELLVYRLPDLPMVGTGGPGDLIDRRLENDRDRFDRIPLGGRPMGLAIASDNRTVYVANFLRNSVQVVDITKRQVTAEVSLGGSHEPETIQRKGMALFYDAGLSLDQWYSCHSCHVDGGSNSRPMDTMNDGSEMTYKTVLPLFNVHQTGPWTWHGWQESLADSVRTSVTSTMIGTAISDQDTEAILEYMKTLQPPPNPFRNPDGSLSDAAKRGEKIFHSDQAGCAECHHGPLLTDGLIHDVGLGADTDVYHGYNTPSLLGLHNKVRWLHSGRAKTLERVVTDLHSPQKVIGGEELTSAETADLIEYLKSL